MYILCLIPVCALCRTPLISAALANIANFTMDIIFIFVFGWGVAGAALATSASQYVGMAAMLYLLNKKRILNFADLRHVPSVSEIAPLLQVSQALLLPSIPCADIKNAMNHNAVPAKEKAHPQFC